MKLHITLEDFLYVFNFKKYRSDDSKDTDIIRIYYDDGNPQHWFEFGLNDWEGDSMPIANTVLNRRLLQSIVCSMSVRDSGVLEVFLTEHPEGWEDE